MEQTRLGSPFAADCIGFQARIKELIFLVSLFYSLHSVWPGAAKVDGSLEWWKTSLSRQMQYNKSKPGNANIFRLFILFIFIFVFICIVCMNQLYVIAPVAVHVACPR